MNHIMYAVLGKFLANIDIIGELMFNQIGNINSPSGKIAFLNVDS